MRLTLPALALLASLMTPAAHAAPVLMISIDGLRPADVLDAQARGTKVPNLERMVREGAWASGVRGTLPTVTYPNHTTLVTGAWPDRHGIAANNTFDPLRRNAEGWYWYAPAIKVPTLWEAVHATGRVTASLGWPVSVDNPSIDDNIPEYWRTRTPEDAPLVEALSTPRGFAQAAMKSAGVDLTNMVDYLLLGRQKVRAMMEKGLPLPQIIKQFHMNEYVGWDRTSHFDWMAETIHRELQGLGPIVVKIIERDTKGVITGITEEGRYFTVDTGGGAPLRLRVSSDTNIEGVPDRTRFKVGQKIVANYEEPQGFNPALGYDIIEVTVQP